MLTNNNILINQKNVVFLISGATIDVLNRFVDINFDPNAYGPDATGPVVAANFAIAFNQNGGTTTAVSISSITNTAGGALVGGENAIRVNLTLTGDPSGVETINIRPAVQGSIRDNIGRHISGADGTGFLELELEYDPMYKAGLLTAITAEYNVPTSELRNVHNDWFLAARASGYLTRLDGIHITNYGADFSNINFVTAAVVAADVGTPVYQAYNGVLGATSPTSYKNLGYNPTDDAVLFAQNDACAFVFLTNDATVAATVFGARGSGSGVNYGHVRITPDNAGNATGIMNANNSGFSTQYATTDTTGVHMIDRNASNSTKQYLNGVDSNTSADASSTLTNKDFFLMCENNNGTNTSINTLHQVALVAWGQSCRSYAADISTHGNALLTDSIALTPNLSGKLYSWIGQSNAGRAGALSEAPLHLRNGPFSMANGYDANCYVWVNGWEFLEPGVNGVSVPGGTLFSPLYSFAYEESIKYPGENLFFVFGAIGGTGMYTSGGGNEWLPGGTLSTAFELYRVKYSAAISNLTSVTAFMPCYWWQGETDARTSQPSIDYGPAGLNNEDVVFDEIKLITGHTDFIVVNLHQDIDPAVYLYVTNVRTAKSDNFTAGIYGTNGAIINVNDLTLGADLTHLTTAASITAGQRMSAAYP